MVIHEVPSWNQLAGWLRDLENLQAVARGVPSNQTEAS